MTRYLKVVIKPQHSVSFSLQSSAQSLSSTKNRIARLNFTLNPVTTSFTLHLSHIKHNYIFLTHFYHITLKRDAQLTRSKFDFRQWKKSFCIKTNDDNDTKLNFCESSSLMTQRKHKKIIEPFPSFAKSIEGLKS